MNDKTIMCPEPMAPCSECIENAQHSDENMAIVYCHHRKFGGIFQTEIGQWQIVGPFGNESEFKRAMYNSFARRRMAKSV